MSHQLPAGFEVLEPFVEYWAVPGTAARDRKRGASTPAQRKAFYETAKGLIPQALALLDARPAEAYDAREENLMSLVLAFAHVTMAVEMLKDAEPRHAKFREVMRITASPEGL